jgi:hypothetical protein
MMQKLNFPLQFQFRITTLANDFVVTDANGSTVAYVRQKMFRFLEEVVVYRDREKSEEMYRIKADRWLDFTASYMLVATNGIIRGRVLRKGWASLWKARYELYDDRNKPNLLIQEENPWVKVADTLLGEIPLVGTITGYIFNPSYRVLRMDGTMVARLRKEPSLLGRQFSVTKLAELDSQEEERLVLGLMMMILLERRRG